MVIHDYISKIQTLKIFHEQTYTAKLGNIFTILQLSFRLINVNLGYAISSTKRHTEHRLSISKNF